MRRKLTFIGDDPAEAHHDIEILDEDLLVEVAAVATAAHRSIHVACITLVCAVPITVVMQATATSTPAADADAPTDPSMPDDALDSRELSDVDALLRQAMATFASMAEEWKKALNDILIEGRDTAASARECQPSPARSSANAATVDDRR